ncbi:AsmA family protein [Flavobacteriaceae bacterium AU392]|nr:AsmA family protein [Flavobacteriaceae bacterium]RKM81673.1 AsmA family protein [Flavobacteriaceae bacterium AU392]
MKKALKVIGITLLSILILLIVAPFLFKSQIEDLVKNLINDNINAKVEFSNVNISFLSSFPKANVSVNDLEVTNFAPFENENLASIKSIAFTMSIKELFKDTSKDPMVVNSIYVNEALLVLKTDKFGNANYDIAKKSVDEEDAIEKESSGFSIDIEDYKINNSALTYIDDLSKTSIYISELNHIGKGIFSADQSELDTNTEANISFNIDSTSYLNSNPIKLDALIGLDLANSKYTFKENKGYINELPLHFEGYVQQLENGQDIDITFENPESSFKDFLAVIPKAYSKNLDNVETSGDFKVKGIIKGLSSDETIPNLNINIASNNASFKYPDLPKRVKDISINTSIRNTTGNIDDTYILIDKLNFKIDEDIFKSSATLKNLTTNMLVNSNIDGTLNLGNITKAYPIELDKELSGVLKANIRSNFDMKALETNAYERIKNNGDLSIDNFIFSSEDIVNPIHISTANVNFKPGLVTLKDFSAKTGQSDFNADGTITNLLGFLLSDKKLQGNFNLTSDNFSVSDFMVEDETNNTSNKTTSDTESLKIPDFLDCNINANVKNVVYDNLILKDVKGNLKIKDQQASLNNLTSNLFDGKLTINGNVATHTEIPVFNLVLGANDFDIAKSFNGLKLLQNLAPIAGILNGKLNTTIDLSGKLTNEFTPDLNTVSGNSNAEIMTSTVNPLNTEILNQLGGALQFIDFKKLQLKDLKTRLDFANGKVNVKPFNLKYEDIPIEISGSHGFDTSIAYDAVFQVPAKYLGSDVNQLIGRINDSQVNTMTIPITATIGGTYTKPLVKTDLTSAITNLTQQLIEIEKQKLLNKGKNKVGDLIGDLLGGKKTKSNTPDSTKAKDDIIKDGVNNAINSLFKKKKKKKDTVN